MRVRVDLGYGKIITHDNSIDVRLDELGNLHVDTSSGGVIYHHNTWYSVAMVDENEDQ